MGYDCKRSTWRDTTVGFCAGDKDIFSGYFGLLSALSIGIPAAGDTYAVHRKREMSFLKLFVFSLPYMAIFDNRMYLVTTSMVSGLRERVSLIIRRAVIGPRESLG